jgi:hypothetical protein
LVEQVLSLLGERPKAILQLNLHVL